jgi:hypothetical protein
MKRFNRIGLILVFWAYAGTVYSQSVSWKQQPCYDAVEMFGNHLLKVEQSGKWGLVNFDGDILLPCNYTRLTDICDGRFLVLDGNNKVLLLGDSAGSTIKVEGDWFVDNAWPYYSNGLLVVRNSQELWGYMDKSGKVGKAKYQNAFPFFFGFASVCKNNIWHIINTKEETFAVTNGSFREKNFSFASSFTKIEENSPEAMVLISDKVYFVDVYGNVTGDIVSVEGVELSSLESKNLFKCIDGNAFVEIGVNPIVEMTSVKKGSTEYRCYNSSVEKPFFPIVREIGVENDGTIKVGELLIMPQFQEVIALAADRMLVKKDDKWSLLKFDLNEPAVGIILNESLNQEFSHNAPIPFQLKGKREGVRAYTIDDSGKMAFWDIDPESGNFYVPMNHLNEEGEAVVVIGLRVDNVLLNPAIFTRKVSLASGFMVSGPKVVTVTKNDGKASFEITVYNNSEQDAAPFDVSIENVSTMHFDGLQAKQSVTISVDKNVKIPPLEDYIYKPIKVTISETGMSEINYKVNIKFAKP